MAATANLNGQLIIAPALNSNGLQVGLQLSEPPLLTSLSVATWISYAFNIPTTGGNRAVNQGTMTGMQFLMISADHPVLIFLNSPSSTNVWSQFFCFGISSVTVSALTVTSTVDNTNVNIILAGT